MKQIYFFGCSFTAGDELSDDKWFPWKFTENHTTESYYNKRSKTLWHEANHIKYELDNKKQAYPALLTTPNINVTNRAENGKSLRHNIFEIICLLEDRNDISAIYLQLPPIGREMYMLTGGWMTSLQMACPSSNENIQRYNTVKAVTHDPRQASLEDFMDLVMLYEYVKSKNVRFKLIIVGPELQFRIEDLSTFPMFKEIVNSVITKIPMLDLHGEFPPESRLLGHHLNLEGHRLLASYIDSDLSEFIK